MEAITAPTTQHDDDATAADQAGAKSIEESLCIDQLLTARNQAVTLTIKGLATLAEANALAVAGGLGGVWGHLISSFDHSRYSRYHDNTKEYAAKIAAACTKGFDAEGWDFLLKASGLRTFMDAKARDDWDKAIHKQETPELTRANILATFETMHACRQDMVERGVLSVFKALSWNYKTNLPNRFGKRLIVRNVRSYSYSSANSLDDLMRALCIFDRKPEPDHRRGIGNLIDAAARAGERTASNEYMSLRWFGNGNAHVTFKPDAMKLVDRLNRIIAKHHPNALGAPRKSRGSTL